MARKCQISGVSRQYGHRVSHSKNRTNHVFNANLQRKRIFLPEEGRFVVLKVTTRMIRTIDRLGLRGALRKFGLTLQDLA